MIDRLSKEEQRLLKDLLIKYFSGAKFGAKNFFQRDSIASLLRSSLLNLGYWKNRKRNSNPVMSDQMIKNKIEAEIKRKQEEEEKKRLEEETAKDPCPF